jgi:hypothetical protein
MNRLTRADARTASGDCVARGHARPTTARERFALMIKSADQVFDN